MERVSRKLRRTSAGAAVLLMATLAWGSQGAEGEGTAEELVGVWTAERHFGPTLEGELLVEQIGDVFRAEIGGVEALARFEDGELRAEWPAGLGELRARFDAERRNIQGHWIQPPSRKLWNAYASPVRLTAAGPGLWQGEVHELEDRFDLHLVIRQGEEGLTGFFRNPQRNAGVFLRFDRLERRDGEMILSRQGSEVVRGPWHADSGTFTLFIQGDSYDFSRREAGGARGFSPRIGEGPYVYRRPPALDDGWRTASLRGAGLRPESVERWMQKLTNLETKSLYTPYLQAVLVAHRGKLVLEEYFFGFDRETPHDSRSAGKSLGSALVGAAVDRGLFSPTSRVLPMLAGRWPVKDPDPRLAALEVGHLLTMSGGFDCDDNDSETPGHEDRMQSQEEQPDWIRYMLEVPMVRPPAERAIYCSGALNVLSGVLEEGAGRWGPELFAEWLARPLGIETYHLNLTPTGEAYLGGGWRLRPRDLLKFGQLFLDDGRWNGRQVLSEEWVRRSVAPHASINSEDDYGYAWWRMSYDQPDGPLEAFNASGNGGQLLVVIPRHELVVLFHGGNYANYGTWRHFHQTWIPEYLLPALVEGKGGVEAGAGGE